MHHKLECVPMSKATELLGLQITKLSINLSFDADAVYWRRKTIKLLLRVSFVSSICLSIKKPFQRSDYSQLGNIRNWAAHYIRDEFCDKISKLFFISWFRFFIVDPSSSYLNDILSIYDKLGVRWASTWIYKKEYYHWIKCFLWGVKHNCRIRHILVYNMQFPSIHTRLKSLQNGFKTNAGEYRSSIEWDNS